MVIGAVVVGCDSEEHLPAPEEALLAVFSASFENGASIPARYTCNGEDISPQISWATPPAGTQSMAIIMDDLNSQPGLFTHWIVYNIPAESRELKEDIPTYSRLEDGTLQGANDFNRIGYDGPCPPSGMHRYRFNVYALNTMLELEAEATKELLTEAMEGHVLARGIITGTYGK